MRLAQPAHGETSIKVFYATMTRFSDHLALMEPATLTGLEVYQTVEKNRD